MARRKRRKGFETPCRPGKGGKFTGETVMYGGEEKLVYRELIPYGQRSVQEQARDENGDLAWKPVVPGQPPRPQRHRRTLIPAEIEVDGEMVPNPEAYREYIVIDSGHGVTSKVFNFRPDPEAVKKREKEAARAKWVGELLDVMADQDIDPAALADAIKQSSAGEVERQKEEAAEAPLYGEPVVEETAPGVFTVTLGEEVVGEDLTEDQVKKLVDSLKLPIDTT